MISGSEIYWITRCSYFHNIGWIFGVIGTIFSGIMIIGVLVSVNDGDEDTVRWFVKRLIPGLVVTLLLWCAYAFIPTTKEMCAIIAIPAVVNNEEVQKMPERVVNLANEWIDELRPKQSAGDGKKALMDSSP